MAHAHRRVRLPVAAFVAGLEVVAVYVHDRAVGQVAEGAADRGRGGVPDNGKNCPLRQGPCAVPLKLKVAPLLIVTPLATTLSVFDLFRFALKL